MIKNLVLGVVAICIVGVVAYNFFLVSAQPEPSVVGPSTTQTEVQGNSSANENDPIVTNSKTQTSNTPPPQTAVQANVTNQENTSYHLIGNISGRESSTGSEQLFRFQIKQTQGNNYDKIVIINQQNCHLDFDSTTPYSIFATYDKNRDVYQCSSASALNFTGGGDQ